LGFYRQLYEVEHAAEARIEAEGKQGQAMLEAQIRHSLRQETSRPVLERFKLWLEGQKTQVIPKSPMGQAIGYTLNNWEALCRYTEDGDLSIDNNVAEREMKRLATGRKNWLFTGSDNGGKTAAVLFSMVSSAMRHGLDPEAYLRGVLAELPSTPVSEVEKFLPDRWKKDMEEAAKGMDATNKNAPAADQADATRQSPAEANKIAATPGQADATAGSATKGAEGTHADPAGTP
jgi:hypothetical protein